MKNPNWIVPAFLVVLAVGYFLGRAGQAPVPAPEQLVTTTWTCAMHPQVQASGPGSCPICGMELIPATQHPDAAPTSLQLDAREQKLAGVETHVVEFRSVERELDLFGRLEVPQSARRTVTARVEGRIEVVHVGQDGAQVRRDLPLVDLYSPQLYAAQQEFLDLRSRGGELLDAARERLVTWGLSTGQVAELERRAVARDVVTLRAPAAGIVLQRDVTEGTWVTVGTPLYEIAPLDPLWLQLEVYESDLAGVREGLRVHFELQAFAGETFEGVVDFVGRVVDPSTHSIFARVVVKNPDGRLRPGMFVRAGLRAPVNDGEPVLVIPASAPLITGRRAVVYVQNPDHPGEYHLRQIELGPRAGDSWLVRSGLAAGEQVVSRGAFRIDSSLQIQGRPSMMSAPEAQGGLR